jgi:nucleoid-associated protein EbfC
VHAGNGVPSQVVPAAYSRGMFPGGQPDMAQLLQQAQQMQQQLVAAQEELARTEVTGTAGGGLVTVTMTGSGDVTAVTIAPAAVDPDDLETLQDLVVAALHDAKREADALAAQTMGPLAGGLGGGGGLGLPGL